MVSQWATEVRRFCRNVPVILVGNKTDLRNDQGLFQELARLGQIPVTSDHGRQVNSNQDRQTSSHHQEAQFQLTRLPRQYTLKPMWSVPPRHKTGSVGCSKLQPKPRSRGGETSSIPSSQSASYCNTVGRLVRSIFADFYLQNGL